jgi:non-heme chloroperoxidase
VPIALSALRTAKMVRGATLRVYPGLPHGMCATNEKNPWADLFAPERTAILHGA